MDREAPAPGRAIALLARLLAGTAQTARLEVRGHCMAPLVVEGDEVEVRADPAAVRRGALVVALADNREPVCHRVLGRDRDGRLLLAGDGSGRVDVVADHEVVGVVLEVRRGARVLRLGRAPGRWLDWGIAALRWHTLAMDGDRPLLVRAVRRVAHKARRLLVRARWLSWSVSKRV